VTDRPRVIVTNDDGIESTGLQVLAGSLSDDYEVIVAAPSGDMSGSGTGIGRFEPDQGVELTPVDVPDVTEAYRINGPPGLAVTAAALGAFGPLPDLVFSGINAGMNTGHSVIHSGTVGAALTARTFEMKAIAISLAQSEPWHWRTAAAHAPSLAAWMLERRGGPDILNVNVPALPLSDVKGVHWADLDEFGYFRVATADVASSRLQFVVRAGDQRSDPGSDTVLCEDGYVTLTPLSTVEPAPFPDVQASEVCRLKSPEQDTADIAG
jgi:5'-nucleotidase